jgi:hypothetical protein
MTITEIARNKTPRSAGTVGKLWCSIFDGLFHQHAWNLEAQNLLELEEMVWTIASIASKSPPAIVADRSSVLAEQKENSPRQIDNFSEGLAHKIMLWGSVMCTRCPRSLSNLSTAQ